MEINEKIRAYSLQNAMLHDGKASASAVIGKLIADNPKLRNNIKELAIQVNKVIREINKIPLEKQISELKRKAPELLEKKHGEEKHELASLPGATDNVVLRYAPFPSGPLHIGNVYPAIINDEYRKKYNGRLLLIIDDTIGSEEKQIVKEAYDLIPQGLNFLGIKYEIPILYKSDRLEIYYKHAEELISKNSAYVCFCNIEKLRENRNKGKECECREHDNKTNLKEWAGMLAGKHKEGEATLRIKTSMKHPNPAFRDRVLFRISHREHPRVGSKYIVWPLLEFSWAVDDHLLGITHVMRGKDLMIESEMEEFIWSIFGWEKPVLLHTGLIKLEGIKLSKSKSQHEIKTGQYSGWDDPRTWSVQSLARRGIHAEAIRKFCLNFGFMNHEATAPIDMLYAENRKITEKSNRYFFIANPKKIRIEKAMEMTVGIPLHQDYIDRGTRNFSTKNEFYIAEDDYKWIAKNKGNYRLMHLFNFKYSKKFEFVSKELDENLKAKLIHWLPAEEENIKAEVMMPDGSFIQGLAEKGIQNLKEGGIIQFERFGFCRLDRIEKSKDKGQEKDKFVFWFSHK
jgi:glutamyl-tRNA synthetase